MRYIKNTIACLSINSRQFFNVTNNHTGRNNKSYLPNLPNEIIYSEMIKYVHYKITSVYECITTGKNKEINLIHSFNLYSLFRFKLNILF